MTISITESKLNFVLKSPGADANSQGFSISTEIHNNKLYKVSIQGSSSSTLYFYSEKDLKELTEALLSINKVLGIEAKENETVKKKLDEVMEQGRLVDLK